MVVRGYQGITFAFFSVSHLFCVATMAVCPIDPVSTTATATDTEHC